MLLWAYFKDMLIIMKLQKKKFYALIYAVLAFAFSMYVLPFYTEGDQHHYSKFYTKCFLPGEDQWFCYTNTLSSVEPVYFFLSKFAHLFLDKVTFISIFNALFAYLLTFLVFSYYKPVWHRQIFIWLIFLNYYIYVLFFAAERLKFGFIFVCMSLALTKRKRFLLFLLGVLSHVQMVFMITPYLTNLIFKSELSKFKKIGILFIGAVSGFGLFMLLGSHIESKVLSYSANDDSNLMGVIKTAVFVVLAVASTRKFDPLVAAIPLLFASLILGGERIVVLSFFMYLGYVIYYNRKMDIPMAIVLIYFVYSGYQFLSNILNYGSGYPG